MKVTVKTFLNVRVGKPSVNAPCYQYLAPGTELEVDGNLYPGDRVEGIDTWLKDEAGNYYWSGGVNNAPETKVAPPVSDQYWWLNDYHIPYIHSLGLTGKGIKVAVLDTGVCINHPVLSLNTNLMHDVTESLSGVNDIYGHGTHCIGIINASKGKYGQLGIAPDAIIFVCKITKDSFGDSKERLAKGLEWAINQEVDIISISKGSFDDYGSGVTEQIEKGVSKGILFVCAAGNKKKGFPNDHICFPARYRQILSVGAVDQNKEPIESSILSGETKIFAPGENILSTYLNNDAIQMSGSSQATPFIAGICALILQRQREANPTCKAAIILNQIQHYSDSFQHGLIVNPLKIF